MRTRARTCQSSRTCPPLLPLVVRPLSSPFLRPTSSSAYRRLPPIRLFRFLRRFGESCNLADLRQDHPWFWPLADPGMGDFTVGPDYKDGPTSVIALSVILLPKSPLAARNPGVVVEHVGLQPRRPGEVEGLGRLGDPDGDHRSGGEVDLILLRGQRLEVLDVLF